MTDAARARVEALAREWLDENIIGHHEYKTGRLVDSLTDCLLDFAAAQRDEEREACGFIAEEYANRHDTSQDAMMRGCVVAGCDIARVIRARREGSG